MNLDDLARLYREFTLASIARLHEFYAEDAFFKDPFNEVTGIAAIERIFAHMFEQLAEPRFAVLDQIAQGDGAMLVWELRYRARGWGGGGVQSIRGVSHLRFDAAGKVAWHRDYWDAAEELYQKLPLLGTLMRALRKRLATRQPG